MNPAAARTQGGIAKAIGELRDEIEVLHNCVESLKQRLGPVLVDSEAGHGPESATQKPPKPPSSILRDSVESATGRIAQARLCVADLLSNLDIGAER